ncbi:cysteine-rich CWC family protein [Paenimyroides marinum]|uniref:cysteine-rich CWC family protein n=1 Tax=Paenimyroides marinum TaxID=1159016 RepID=UPI000B8882F9|nr:cysteine-rich CWC family protein [Paenimyroides aquimaris]
MAQHEEKYCPRCKTVFECKVGSILLCQCSEVKLNSEERDFINEQFDDCLCANCMKELKAEYHNQKFQNKLKRILGIFYNNPNKK